MGRVSTALAVSAAACIIGFSGIATAGTKTVRNPTIMMKAGNSAGLHEVYAWDERCRSVKVSVKPMAAKNGKLYTVRGRFKISARQSKQCAGRSVSGHRVVFKADKKFRGITNVRYAVKPSNINDTYLFTRTLLVR